MTTRPPAVATWLIRHAVAASDRDAILGDLEEEFRSRATRDGLPASRHWYWRQVRRSVPHYVRERIGRGDRAASGAPTPLIHVLDGSLQDARRAVRSLRATPGFTIVALAVLALGIGATTAIYSVVDGVVLRGLPYADDSRLVLISEPNTRIGRGPTSSLPEFHDWRAAQTTFTDLGASRGAGSLVSRDGDTVETLRGTLVSASLMPVLGARPAIGRLFTPQDEIPGQDHVAILADGFWRRHFGGRTDVVGKTLTFDTGTWTVIGVMPPTFTYSAAFTTPMDVWMPIAPQPAALTRTGRSDFSFQVIGRLKPGQTIERARADLERVTSNLRAGAPPNWFANRGLALTSLRDSIVGSAKAWMLMLLGAVAFVLLIACVNVANLLLARATTRVRDAAVRSALGASRWRILRGLLIESLILSVAGTALGVAMAVWGVDVLRAALPPNLPRLAQVAVNYRVLIAATAVAVAVAFGVTPVWQASPGTSGAALRDAGRSGSAGAGRGRARGLLLAAEIALAVVLLVGSGLFLSSFIRLVRVDLGFDMSNVLQVDLSPRGKATDAYLASMSTTVTSVMDAVRHVSGVEHVALVSGTPPLLLGNDRIGVTVPGKPTFVDADDADEKLISPGYFDVLRVPVIRGRAFEAEDMVAGAPRVVILNDVAATRYFGQDNPIGTTVQMGTTTDAWTIVGVVRAVRLQGPESDPRPEVYTPINWQEFRGNPLLMLVIRTAGNPAPLAPVVKSAIRTIAPAWPTPPMETYDELFSGLVAQRKFNMIVLALFGVLAIAIAGTGIYGVMAYVVEQRTQEIGVRMALGAEPGRVLRMVLAHAMRTMMVGLGLGLTGGWLLARFVRAFLFKSDAHDPVVYVAVGLLVVLAGLAAAIVPARRASRVDPLVALRAQ